LRNKKTKQLVYLILQRLTCYSKQFQENQPPEVFFCSASFEKRNNKGDNRFDLLTVVSRLQ